MLSRLGSHFCLKMELSCLYAEYSGHLKNEFFNPTSLNTRNISIGGNVSEHFHE